jgi:hypothetical protein
MPARTTLPFSATVLSVHRQMLGFQHLQLQRHHQPVLDAAVAQADQRFAAFEHRPAGERLQAVEIGESRGVGFFGPVPEERLQPLAQNDVGDHRLRLDAGADGVGDEGIQRRRGPGIAAHQIATLGAQLGLGCEQCSDRAGIAGHPGERAPPAAGAVVDRQRREARLDPRPEAHQKPLPVVTRIWRVRRLPAARARDASTSRIAAWISSTLRYSTVLSPKVTRFSPVASAFCSASSCSLL